MKEMDTERDHVELAPWWADAQIFHISAVSPVTIVPGENGKFDWDTLAQSKESFTTHCPIDRGFFERCHALGVRCFPYVVFYAGPAEVSFGAVTSTTYQGVDFGSHPE